MNHFLFVYVDLLYDRIFHQFLLLKLVFQPLILQAHLVMYVFAVIILQILQAVMFHLIQSTEY